MRDNSGRSDRLLQGLLLWTALTTLIFWLPSIRGLFDGASYEWGAFGFRGRGIAGDYWFVATGSLAAIALQFLAWRGPRAAFYVMFGGWHLYLAVATALAAIADPASLHFTGDTLGVDVSLAVAAPTFMGIAAALVLFWIVRDARGGISRPALSAWSQKNTRWVLATGSAAADAAGAAASRRAAWHDRSDRRPDHDRPVVPVEHRAAPCASGFSLTSA